MVLPPARAMVCPGRRIQEQIKALIFQVKGFFNRLVI